MHIHATRALGSTNGSAIAPGGRPFRVPRHLTILPGPMIRMKFLTLPAEPCGATGVKAHVR